MSTKPELFIVEAPGKTQALLRLLSDMGRCDPVVLATYGRLYDFPDKDANASPDTLSLDDRIALRPNQIIKLTEAMASASHIWIMTDADDEGDWIGEDLVALALSAGQSSDKISRRPMGSLTTTGLEKAFSVVDYDGSAGADAARTRRLIDRIIGYSRKPNLVTPIPAPMGRVVTPTLCALKKMAQNDPSLPALVTAVVSRDIDDYSVVINVRPGQSAEAAANMLAGLSPPELEWGDAEVTQAEVESGPQTLVRLSRELPSPVNEISDAMQCAYIAGRISYPRSDSNAADPEHIKKLAHMAHALGIKLDQRRINAQTGGIDHTAVLPVTQCSNIDIEPGSLALEDQVVNNIAHNAFAAANPMSTRHTRYAKVAQPYDAQWADLLQQYQVTIIKTTTGSSHGRPLAPASNSRGDRLGEELYPGVRVLKIQPDAQVLSAMVHCGLGRPSTISGQATRIAKAFLDDRGCLNKRAEQALTYAGTQCPRLLDLDTVREMEDIAKDPGGGSPPERARKALAVMGLVTADGAKAKDKTKAPELGLN